MQYSAFGRRDLRSASFVVPTSVYAHKCRPDLHQVWATATEQNLLRAFETNFKQALSVTYKRRYFSRIIAVSSIAYAYIQVEKQSEKLLLKRKASSSSSIVNEEKTSPDAENSRLRAAGSVRFVWSSREHKARSTFPSATKINLKTNNNSLQRTTIHSPLVRLYERNLLLFIVVGCVKVKEYEWRLKLSGGDRSCHKRIDRKTHARTAR